MVGGRGGVGCNVKGVGGLLVVPERGMGKESVEWDVSGSGVAGGS